MNLIAISGSLKSTSNSSALIRAIAFLVPLNCTVDIYNGLNDLPHFNPELDTDSPPATVLQFRKRLKIADAVLICTPEYAFSIPGVLKNALDWTVSSGEWVEKPVAVISSSPSYMGGDKAHASLLLTLSALSAKVSEDSNLIISAINKKINSQDVITDPDIEIKLRMVIAALIKPIQQNKFTISIL